MTRLSSFTVTNVKSFDKHTRYYTWRSFMMNLKHLYTSGELKLFGEGYVCLLL